VLLSRAPRAILVGLRAVRTLALMAAGPFARRTPASGGPVPPLWLRRHTGPVSRIEASADGAASVIEELGLLPPNGRIVDAGCGFGIMAMRLGPTL